MARDYNVTLMSQKIAELKNSAKELRSISGGIQAVDRNVDRILALIAILEFNISDVKKLIK